MSHSLALDSKDGERMRPKQASNTQHRPPNNTSPTPLHSRHPFAFCSSSRLTSTMTSGTGRKSKLFVDLLWVAAAVRSACPVLSYPVLPCRVVSCRAVSRPKFECRAAEYCD